MKTTGIVHIYELPENEVCVRLPKNLQEKMFLLASRIAGNNMRLAKTLGINKTTLLDFKKARFASTRLIIVKKLSEFLILNGYKKYSLDNLERKVLAIKTHWVGKFIYNPKFPINFNSENGAIVISAILFDGGITSYKYPFYTNSKPFLLNKFIKNVKRTVGNTIYCSRKTRESTKCIFFPKVLGLILIHGLNIPSGKKIFTNPEIPEFILKGSKGIKKAFLQQAFDDEGSPSPGKNRSGRNVELPQSGSLNEPPLRLLGLKRLVSQFGIPVNGPYRISEYVSKSKIKTYQWSVQITNQRDIRRFAKEINFSLPEKRLKLKRLLESYILPERFKKGENVEVALEACKALEFAGEKITIKNVALELNRGEIHTKDIMNKLVNQHKLTVVKSKSSPTYFGEGFKPKEFDVVVK